MAFEGSAMTAQEAARWTPKSPFWGLQKFPFLGKVVYMYT